MTQPEPATLTTARLTLRPRRIDDAARIAELIGDFDVCRMLSTVPYPYTIDDAHAWLAAPLPLIDGQALGWALDNGSGLIGYISFRKEDGPHPVIGYWLAKPYWRQGLMTEAVRAAVDHLFAVTNAEAIRSGLFDDNDASGAVQRKLGFAEIGRSTRFNLARGAEFGHIDTELSRATWMANG